MERAIITQTVKNVDANDHVNGLASFGQPETIQIPEPELLAKIDIVQIHMNEAAAEKHNNTDSKGYARQILAGQLAIGPLEIIRDSNLLPELKRVQIEKFLSDNRVQFLKRYFKDSLLNTSTKQEKLLAKRDQILTDAKREEHQTSLLISRVKSKNKNFNLNSLETYTQTKIALVEESKLAFEKLVLTNLFLAINIAKRKRATKNMDIGDIISAAEEGLMIAAAKYKVTYGFEFSTFATWWIKQNVSRKIREQGSVVSIPVNITEKWTVISKAENELLQKLERSPTKKELIDYLGKEYSLAINSRYMSAIDSLNRRATENSDTELGDLIMANTQNLDDNAEQTELKEAIEKAINRLDPRGAKVIRMRWGIDEDRPYTLEEVGDELGVTRERARQIEFKKVRELRTILKPYIESLTGKTVDIYTEPESQALHLPYKSPRVIKTADPPSNISRAES